MANAELIDRILDAAVDEVNAAAPADLRCPKDRAAVLFGAGGALDSLGLVNLIIAVEARVAEAFEITVALADDAVMSRERSPFRTLAALRDHVESLVGAVVHG